ncbi:unnamed protein product [Arabidopsis arenosa]|nr:unnamed protein product [Arabidopsis arenosa]
MKHLRILLVDGTALEEIQMILHFKESLQHLCLSGNSMINLPANIKQLNHLKWLDLKFCENLIELPTLPPNLEYLDAHGYHKLERVMDPLAVALITEQICSTFIFTNCTNLEEDARNTNTSYAERTCQLHAFKCYDMVFSHSLSLLKFPSISEFARAYALILHSGFRTTSGNFPPE